MRDGTRRELLAKPSGSLEVTLAEVVAAAFDGGAVPVLVTDGEGTGEMDEIGNGGTMVERDWKGLLVKLLEADGVTLADTFDAADGLPSVLVALVKIVWVEFRWMMVRAPLGIVELAAPDPGLLEVPFP